MSAEDSHVTKAKKRKLDGCDPAWRKLMDQRRCRVNIGEAFTRWRALKIQRGLETDAEVALFLLDCFPTEGSFSAKLHSTQGVDWSSSDESFAEASDRCSFVTLSKEVLLILMYRCLECSSECQIQGKGKGGSLTLRQECLICSNCRVWTSQTVCPPKNKVDDISLILSCDDVGLQTSENVSATVDQDQAQTQPGKASVNTEENISSRAVQLEQDEPKQEDKSLLKETHEDNSSGPTVDRVDDDGLNLAKVKNETAESAEPEPLGEMFIGEDGRAKPADEATHESSRKRQHEGSHGCLSNSSYEFTESSEEESEVESTKKSQKLFQNTIKPVIWCLDCEAVAKMLCTVRRHQRIYGCMECGDRNSAESESVRDFSVHFSDIVSFHKHAMDVHGASENQCERKMCPDCNKSFKVDTDPNKKGHVCAYKIKPFSCDLCRKRFSTENGQKVHHRRLHGDYTHICKYCMMAFNTKPSKLDHELSHSQDKLPYICPDCPEKFKDFVTRNQHLKTHRGQKKFICHACNRIFVSLQRYERHMRIHSGEKPYTCAVCERSFNQDGHLKSHMRLHTGEKPFMCERCGTCFNHNVSLKNHLRRQHGMNSNHMSVKEKKQRGRPTERSYSSDKGQRKKQKPKSSSKYSAEGVAQDLDSLSESSETDSDGEQQERGQPRKARKKKLIKNNADEDK
ncbi:zinc finger protein 878-like [Trichomycterus rosablanca]|uniref:zinc finger protein 878-like n=1 Tax=Trichomycterus rosablanca TaxID=2290929 RepID=UPI002F3557AD